ncbi:hypothetical protein E3P92_01051 [Wallemia ichthyophaga]|uniref:Uncharacterized protein n=1 Tax=Wallemia ichthyophaga TaxID=245174 RepID=A0A4T0IBK1_WALIC|nr:hypothetical protein E3P91_03288 [Wallemia ichthyophaga]TIA79536.1 hypothetical protein E3P98_03234 [Wallemia ichthyophaga]TIB15393.1 hypothetical protein E3P90_00923 [Wallemia ichthyophaga]TIB17218.1 hypothetical protein E3P93_00780 [Wallemia ichthyophaga]TIB17523.1 hypothetical protein E3P92_01051 [Wallemia ichthyophaga]
MEVKSDAKKYQSLSSSLINNNSSTKSAEIDDRSPEEYLEAFEESLNNKVDGEVGQLSDGLSEIIGLAEINQKDNYKISKEAFQISCRSESMIRSANSLLDITHALKMINLLGDDHHRLNVSSRRADELSQERSEAVSELEGAVEQYMHSSDSK